MWDSGPQTPARRLASSFPAGQVDVRFWEVL